ncbi:MAG: DUF1287 domain-containing protein [Vallitalea sp.]|jgi:uncharacterized protein YijF (DUF1287 family)|nr:DUF1287 domain-containing protein [Vallitalea sp.]
MHIQGMMEESYVIKCINKIKEDKMMGKKLKLIIFLVLILTISLGVFNVIKHNDVFYTFRPSIKVETLVCTNDLDSDGINDQKDILEGAREEIKNHTRYKSEYYSGGYPPEGEGVCTDVIWRAFQNAGYSLKNNMDKDIILNVNDYPRIDKIDSNIDFRRVRNQLVFLKKYMTNLTTDIVPYDIDILKEWQGGDIVVLAHPYHIAIISDKRRKDGIPYIIHNSYDFPREEDKLIIWSRKDMIIGHFRFKNVEIK